MALGAISTQTGSLDVIGSTLSSNVLSSLTFAATQDLSAFSAVRTLGYANAGDGGGADFVKTVGTFKDSFVTGISITNGGSGYVNGSYLFVPPSGGTGVSPIITATVSGGAVTALSIVRSGGFGYTVGDVLAISNAYLGGSGSGVSLTVTSVSTPKASFTDSAGNKSQYVIGSTGSIYAKQFGAKFDWTVQGETPVRLTTVRRSKRLSISPATQRSQPTRMGRASLEAPSYCLPVTR